MFLSNTSKTADKKLEEVLSLLKKHSLVDGILLTGSAANKTMHDSSDFDLACVVRNLPKNILGINTFIDNKFAEIFFYSPEEVERALQEKTVALNTKNGWIANWSRDGQIILDKSGVLAKLKDKSKKMKNQVSDTLAYRSWHDINYNFIQNSRYFHSDKKSYLQALDIKFLYSLVEIMVGYFNIRKISWKGEKDAVEWLKKNDQNFLQIFQSCMTEKDRAKKMILYETLANTVLEPAGGLWQKTTTSMVTMGEIDKDTIKNGLNFWEGLLGLFDNMSQKC